jgi:hypothetical protein
MRCAKSASTRVIVGLNEGEEERRAAAGCLDSRSRYFRRVRVVELSPERTPSTLFQSADGRQALYHALMAARLLADGHLEHGQRISPPAPELTRDPGLPTPGPDLPRSDAAQVPTPGLLEAANAVPVWLTTA